MTSVGGIILVDGCFRSQMNTDSKDSVNEIAEIDTYKHKHSVSRSVENAIYQNEIKLKATN